MICLRKSEVCLKKVSIAIEKLMAHDTCSLLEFQLPVQYLFIKNCYLSYGDISNLVQLDSC